VAQKREDLKAKLKAQLEHTAELLSASADPDDSKREFETLCLEIANVRNLVSLMDGEGLELYGKLVRESEKLFVKFKPS